MKNRLCAAVAFAFFTLPFASHASPASAEKAYQNGNYGRAEKEYAATLAKNPKKPELEFNLGSAAYKSGDYAKAATAFQNTLKIGELPVQQGAYYNLGNTQYRVGQNTEKSAPQETIKTWEQAVQSYEAALQIKPNDSDARYNRDLGKKKLDQLKKQQQKQQQQSSPSSVTALAISSPSEAAAANPAATDLAPNKVEPGSFVSSLRPVLFAPWFIALQGLPAMALVIVLVVHCRRQRHAQDLNHTGEHAAEAAIREQLAAMDAALAANCAPAFFRAARHAVQERLAQRWKLPVSQVTVTEINRRLNGNGDDLRALFAFADGVVYSGQRVLPEDLKRWRDTVIQHLKKLEDL